MTKFLVVSDDGVASGFGRISMEVNTRLMKRGYDIHAASYAYDGLLPAQLNGTRLPYHVSAIAGKPNWLEEVLKVANAIQPDVIVSIQDFPYAQQIRQSPLDWSKYGFIIVTPVDGAPIYPRWIEIAKTADAVMTISDFGVQTFKAQGVQVGLLRPGVDVDYFIRLNDDQRAAIRQRLGITPEAFVVGTCAMNQGRKCIAHMLEAFYRFAQDKPDARYIMDMDKLSPAGYDILGMLCEPNGWDASKLLFREDCQRLGVLELRDRMNIMDAHMVIAHREGYGLPLVEAQACGVVSMALDYCSGTEICGDGKGVLIKPVAYESYSTWGGAIDKHPDVQGITDQLQHLYDNPDERKAIANKGMKWARKQTWDRAADSVYDVCEKVLTKRRKLVNTTAQIMTQPLPTAPPQVQPDGQGAVVELMELSK